MLPTLMSSAHMFPDSSATILSPSLTTQASYPTSVAPTAHTLPATSQVPPISKFKGEESEQ